jgi:hypothetical protein
MVLLMMSTPIGRIPDSVKIGARLDLCCLLSAMIQLLYCLLRPSFSQETHHHNKHLVQCVASSSCHLILIICV